MKVQQIISKFPLSLFIINTFKMYLFFYKSQFLFDNPEHEIKIQRTLFNC